MLSGRRDTKSQNVSCAEAACGNAAIRLHLHGVDQVGELDRVLDEEHRDVVADQIEVSLLRVELHGEAADVPGRVARACAARHGGEAREDRRPLLGILQERRARQLAERSVGLKVPVRARATGMNDALRNALVIEVGDLLAKDEVLQEDRAPLDRLQRVLVVGDGNALIRGEDLRRCLCDLMRLASLTRLGCRRGRLARRRCRSNRLSSVACLPCSPQVRSAPDKGNARGWVARHQRSMRESISTTCAGGMQKASVTGRELRAMKANSDSLQ